MKNIKNTDMSQQYFYSDRINGYLTKSLFSIIIIKEEDSRQFKTLQ